MHRFSAYGRSELHFIHFCNLKRSRGLKRKAHGISQEDLAEKIGISITHMSHIETDNTKLSLPVFVSVADALNCRIDELLHESASTDKSASAESILQVMERCTPQQLRVIEDIIIAAKTSFDKNM